ncbi:hypothetical protein CTAYLR_006264 [Chrysophaeum taylorii]|uniref:Major facilitator superfamily (MFS) profile domain-containing protein n=1 Tax=Chrysophaeum taylorii TaxID=2483200 RepID=A0AAD7UKK0_9STRA|nr:hypothetical protein CTAYLR_006264 [Chrysophaeum taylorii]
MDRGARQQRGVVLIVLVNISLYAVSFQLQRPIEPFLVKKLGADDVAYGRLMSFFSLLQSLGSPVVGATLDRIGPRLMFVVVFLSSAASYGILSLSTSMAWLYLSKIPSVFQAGFLVAQALVGASAHTEHDRAAALGRLTTAYTVGATLGPGLGGWFGKRGSYYAGAKLAVVLSLFSAALAFVLPDNRTKVLEKKRPQRGILAVVGRRAIWPLLVVKALTGVSNSALGATLPLVLRDAKFDEQALGLAMSATSMLVAVVGAFALGPLTSACGSSRRLAVAALATKVGSVFAFVPLAGVGPVGLAALSSFHTCVSHVMATSLTSSTTGSVAPDEQGALLGVEHALFAVARIFGPTMGTTLLGFKGGFALVATVCACLDATTLSFAARVKRGDDDRDRVGKKEEQKDL